MKPTHKNNNNKATKNLSTKKKATTRTTTHPLTKSTRKNATKATNSQKVIILGPPGGGKGTISKKLKKDMGFFHISTGDLLRAEISKQSPLGIQAETFIRGGKLVPDQLVIDLVADQIGQAERENQSVLLDGFPRTIAQAEALDKKIKISKVVNLKVPDDEIVGRASSRWTHLPSGRVYSYTYAPPKVQGKDDVTGEDLIQRQDDKLEVVTERLKTYHSLTFPLLDYYQKQSLLTEYDGANQPDLLAAGRRSDAIYVDLKTDIAKLMAI